MRYLKLVLGLKSLAGGLAEDQKGQDLIEYALVAALIALSAVAAMKSLSSVINSTFTSITDSLTSAV